MFDGVGGDPPVTTLTIYTDAFIVRGTILTRQRRVSDILNLAEDRFIVLSDVTTDEFGTRGETVRAEFAQINLNAVLFAVADTKLDTPPELRTPKVAEQALISVPPFKVTGSIYLMPGHDLRVSLAELTGKFVPVTDGDVLVRCPWRGPPDRRARGREPRTSPDPGTARDRRPMGRSRSPGSGRRHPGRRDPGRRARAPEARRRPRVARDGCPAGTATAHGADRLDVRGR